MPLWIWVVDGVISSTASRDVAHELPHEVRSALIGLPIRGASDGRYPADLEMKRPS
jgi:hypothetical protein